MESSVAGITRQSPVTSDPKQTLLTHLDLQAPAGTPIPLQSLVCRYLLSVSDCPRWTVQQGGAMEAGHSWQVQREQSRSASGNGGCLPLTLGRAKPEGFSFVTGAFQREYQGPRPSPSCLGGPGGWSPLTLQHRGYCASQKGGNRNITTWAIGQPWHWGILSPGKQLEPGGRAQMGTHPLAEPLLQSWPLNRAALSQPTGARKPQEPSGTKEKKVLLWLGSYRRKQPQGLGIPVASRLVPCADRWAQGNWFAGGRRSQPVPH